MTTATIEKPKAKPSAAWVKRNGEANLLAGYLFDNSVHRAACNESSANGESPEARRQLNDARALYQRTLILEAARLQGLTTWEGEAITSRRELTPKQYGQVITALRGMIEALGLLSPEEARDSSRAESRDQAPATTSQWRQITLLRDRVGKELGWSEPHFKNWLRSRLKIRGRIRTATDARKVIFGLEGVLKHAKK